MIHEIVAAMAKRMTVHELAASPLFGPGSGNWMLFPPHPWGPNEILVPDALRGKLKIGEAALGIAKGGPGAQGHILCLGAVEEGIIRHERIMPNGRKRNSVRFYIIDDEWPAVKGRLQARLG